MLVLPHADSGASTHNSWKMEGVHRERLGIFQKGPSKKVWGWKFPVGSRGKAPVGHLGIKSPRTRS